MNMWEKWLRASDQERNLCNIYGKKAQWASSANESNTDTSAVATSETESSSNADKNSPPSAS